MFGTPANAHAGPSARQSAASEDPFDLFGGLGTTEQHAGQGDDILGGLGATSGELFLLSGGI